MEKPSKKTGIILILLLIIGVVIITNNISNKKGNEAENLLPTIETVSEIDIGFKQYINQLEKVKIKGTDDSIIITKKVNWEVPEHKQSETVSFSIAIPYTITVDSVEYDGIYELNDSGWYTPDNNPKYNFTVTNLTSNGDIEVMITTK